MRVGYIPENITYVCRKPTKKRTTWDSLKAEITELDVIPCFAAQNEKALETARSWGRTWNHETQQDEDVYEEFESDNTPIKLQIVGLERRSEGGRAYKVINEHGYYFDLREDVLFEAIIAVGIEKDGKMGGEYIWGVLGSQMRLIRNGSALHDSLAELTERKKKKKLSIRDLEPSSVYSTVAGDKEIFFGSVYVDGRKKMLWYTRGTYNHKEAFDHYWGFTLKSSHSMVEKVGNIDQKLTPEFMEELRERATESFHKYRGRNSRDQEYCILRYTSSRNDFLASRGLCVMTLDKKETVEKDEVIESIYERYLEAEDV